MAKTIESDCLQVLPSFPRSSISLTVTSPPYKESDGFTPYLMSEVATLLHRVHRPDTFAFVNFGALREDMTRPYKILEAFCAAGWEYRDTIAWVKSFDTHHAGAIIDALKAVHEVAPSNALLEAMALVHDHYTGTANGHYTPLSGDNLNNLWEPVFVFTKRSGRVRGGLRTIHRLGTAGARFARLALGIPHADPQNGRRWKNGSSIRCRGNVWFIPYATIQGSHQKPHKDRFPPELVRRCITLSGIKSGTVLDPFCGSNTTGMVASEEFGLKSIGINKRGIT